MRSQSRLSRLIGVRYSMAMQPRMEKRLEGTSVIQSLWVNPADCSLISDRIVIFVPDSGGPPRGAGMGARFAKLAPRRQI